MFIKNEIVLVESSHIRCSSFVHKIYILYCRLYCETAASELVEEWMRNIEIKKAAEEISEVLEKEEFKDLANLIKESTCSAT